MDERNYGRQRANASHAASGYASANHGHTWSASGAGYTPVEPLVEPLGRRDYVIGWIAIIVIAFLICVALTLVGLDAVDALDLLPGLDEVPTGTTF